MKDSDPIPDPIADPVPDPIADPIPAPEEEENEGVQNVYEKEMTFCLFYCNAFRYYHRIGNLIFSPNVRSSRVVKAFNTST